MINANQQKLPNFHIILVHNNSILLWLRWLRKMSILIFHIQNFSSKSSDGAY